MQDIVSIIIPSYKGEDNILGVVRSALNQEYDDIEVIVVDDNGVGTEHQVATYNALLSVIGDLRFKYIAHSENKNGSAARNTGVRAAKGKYVAFLDDDDYFYPNKISCCVDALKNTDESYAFAYSAYELVYPGKRSEIISPGFSGDILDAFLCRKIRLCSSSVVLKKSVVDEVGGFDESFKRHQDWEFFIRVLNNHKAVFVDTVSMKKVMLWRNSPSNPKMYEDYRIHFLNKMSEIIDSRDKHIATKVYNSHYFDIAKAYLKSKDILSAVKWIKKTSSPIFYLLKVVPDTIDYIRKK